MSGASVLNFIFFKEVISSDPPRKEWHGYDSQRYPQELWKIKDKFNILFFYLKIDNLSIVVSV